MNIKVDDNAVNSMSEKEKSTYLESIAKTAQEKKDRQVNDKKVVRK